MEWKGRISTNCMQSLRFGLCEWMTASAKRAKTCQQNECKLKFCFFTIYYVYICSFSCFIWHTLNVMGLPLHCNACSHKMYVAQWYKLMNKVIVHWRFAVSWQMFLVIQPNKICYLTSISWFITKPWKNYRIRLSCKLHGAKERWSHKTKFSISGLRADSTDVAQSVWYECMFCGQHNDISPMATICGHSWWSTLLFAGYV